MHYNNRKSLTLFFSIPNVSNLFIYKDNWTDNKVMRPLIAEILKCGQFEVHYLGADSSTVQGSVARNASDCALINLTVQDVDLANRSAQTIKDLLIQELSNRKNRFLFENELIDADKNVTNIHITIKIQSVRKMELERFQAA